MFGLKLHKPPVRQPPVKMPPTQDAHIVMCPRPYATIFCQWRRGTICTSAKAYGHCVGIWDKGLGWGK